MALSFEVHALLGEALQESSSEIQRVCTALSNEHRFHIAYVLASTSAMRAAELTRALNMASPLLYFHLGKLCRLGLVHLQIVDGHKLYALDAAFAESLNSFVESRVSSPIDQSMKLA